MREIKFRAWIKDMVEMVQVNAIILEGATFENPELLEGRDNK